MSSLVVWNKETFFQLLLAIFIFEYVMQKAQENKELMELNGTSGTNHIHLLG